MATPFKGGMIETPNINRIAERGQPVRIWSRIGRRPILAGGNSNGDVPMLRDAGDKNDWLTVFGE